MSPSLSVAQPQSTPLRPFAARITRHTSVNRGLACERRAKSVCRSLLSIVSCAQPEQSTKRLIAYWLRINTIIVMRSVHVRIRQIGNRQGVVIPKPLLVQLGLDATLGVEMTDEDGALVLRPPASPARTGWADAARSIAKAGDDELVMGEFTNTTDSELVW